MANFPPLTPPPPVAGNELPFGYQQDLGFQRGGFERESGGFFDNFKLKDAMPFAAALGGGFLAKQQADNTMGSYLASQQLTADAALARTMIEANLGKDMARFGLNLDQQAKQREFQMQSSGPFAQLLATRAAMGEVGAGFEERAGNKIRLFG